jgi:cysteine synthase
LAELEGFLPQGRLFAKCEYKNPTGSHYDRVYFHLLRKLEQEGAILPGRNVLVETTSGNAGASFAWLCRELGYGCKVFMPDNLPSARIEDVTQYGAEVVLTPGDDYVRGAAEAMGEFLRAENKGKPAEQRKFFSPNHSQKFESTVPLEGIATEALQQMQGLGEKIDVFVPGVGNGATVLGPGRVLKAEGVQVMAAEPFASAKLFELAHPGVYREMFGIEPGSMQHEIYGTGVPDVNFPFINAAVQGDAEHKPVVDAVCLVTDRNTLASLRKKIDPFCGDFGGYYWAVDRKNRPDLLERALQARGVSLTNWANASRLPKWEEVHNELARQGHLVGRSSALCIAAAKAHASEVPGGHNYLVILYDTLRKYEDAHRSALPPSKDELAITDMCLMDF